MAEAERGGLQAGVSLVLLGGVSLSAALIAAGLVAALSGGGGAGLLRAGTAALIATPVLRIVVLAVGFARDGEWRFFWTCASLLALLALASLAR